MKHAMSPSYARPSTSKRCAGTTAVECGVGPSTSGTWCSTSSRAIRTTTGSLQGAYKLRTIDGVVFVNAWNIEQLHRFYP